MADAVAQFVCNKCNIHYSSHKLLEEHNATQKHLANGGFLTQKTPKTRVFFQCKHCDFNSSKKSEWERHLATRKHKSLTDSLTALTGITPNKSQNVCTHCFKEYKSREGLWYHSQKCNSAPDTVAEPTENVFITPPAEDVKVLTTMVGELMKSNGELQKQMMEMCKNSNMIINNNMNSHNKTFNLNFFLNEQCKDAMNLSEFMNSFELQLTDLESIGELGYVEGMTKIMVDRLNAMDIYKRPVHCSDAKRETLYVKNDDKWEKEARNNPKLRYAIKTASFQSMKLTVLWSDTYPESKSSESRLNDKYMKLVFNSTGGTGEIADSEDKIIRRILKEIVIEKNMN
jgi:hypothetical protein